MRYAKLIDPDGDRLLIHGTPEVLFVTVADEDRTLTVGGFTRAQLDELMDFVAPPTDGPAIERRTLTADDIESVLHSILPLSTEHLGADDIADIASDLYTALIEPPRPEGAEELEEDMAAWYGENGMPVGGTGDRLADHLAALGYRKAGVES